MLSINLTCVNGVPSGQSSIEVGELRLTYKQSTSWASLVPRVTFAFLYYRSGSELHFALAPRPVIQKAGESLGTRLPLGSTKFHNLCLLFTAFNN